MTRMLRLLAAALLTAGTIVAVQAGPAQAAAGYVVMTGSSPSDSNPEKSAIAFCPVGKRVSGGGGGVYWDAFNSSREIMITQMQPVHGTYQDYFMVTGHETVDGESANWSVTAWASCVDPLPGMHIVSSMSDWDSDSVKMETPDCDDGEVVLGSGAYIYGSYGYVGLQVMRASLVTDFSYAQGREEIPYAGVWFIVGYAVCADPPSGYEIVQWASSESDSETIKAADAQCPEFKEILGAGGALGFNATGHASLIHVGEPWFNNRQTWAAAVEHTATTSDWDFIVGQAICAY